MLIPTSLTDLGLQVGLEKKKKAVWVPYTSTTEKKEVLFFHW